MITYRPVAHENWLQQQLRLQVLGVSHPLEVGVQHTRLTPVSKNILNKVRKKGTLPTALVPPSSRWPSVMSAWKFPGQSLIVRVDRSVSRESDHVSDEVLPQ